MEPVAVTGQESRRLRPSLIDTDGRGGPRTRNRTRLRPHVRMEPVLATLDWPRRPAAGVKILKKHGSAAHWLLVPAASLSLYSALVRKRLRPGFWTRSSGAGRSSSSSGRRRVTEVALSKSTPSEIAQLCSSLNGRNREDFGRALLPLRETALSGRNRYVLCRRIACWTPKGVLALGLERRPELCGAWTCLRLGGQAESSPIRWSRAICHIPCMGV